MKQFNTKVLSNKKIAPEHYILSFKAPKTAEIIKPGQFFNIRINKSYQPLLRRPFSVYKIGKDKVEILYKVVGKATQDLSSKKKNDTLDIIGPLGNAFNVESSVINRQSSVILVAGGHGIAPLYALAKQVAGNRCRVAVFIGARTKKYIVCEKDFKKLGAKISIATEDGSKGYKGLITDLLERKICVAGYKPQVTMFACGPKPMLKSLAKLAKRYKIPCQVSLEEYMACGTGTCLGCAVKAPTGYKLVCKDGPVFDSKEIVWQ